MKPAGNRSAFSLLEVILATTILLFAVVALGELVRNGLNAATRARDISQAQLLCESKLAEIAAGILPPDPVTDLPLLATVDQPDLSEWVYSVEVFPLDQPELIQVRVTVRRNAQLGGFPFEFSLIRWMRNPEVDQEAAADVASGGGL